MRMQPRDFDGWYLDCTAGKYHRDELRQRYGKASDFLITHRKHGYEKGLCKVPTFEEILEMYGGPVKRAKSVLFVPRYPRGTHEKWKNRKIAILKGYNLKPQDQSEAFRGHIDDIMRKFEAENGRGPNNAKVVVVDLGYHTMNDYLKTNYGWVKELST